MLPLVLRHAHTHAHRRRRRRCRRRDHRTRSGDIQYDELRKGVRVSLGLGKSEVSDEAVQALFAMIDTTGTGVISKAELFSFLRFKWEQDEGKLEDLWHTFEDKDGNAEKVGGHEHEKIVQAMSPEELQDPQLMVDDIDSINTGETKGPRVQRLAIESGVGEKDVLLFVAEFEAMRESTARIAKGEDPDKVNASLGEGKGNRSQRRATKKAQKKAIKKGSLP